MKRTVSLAAINSYIFEAEKQVLDMLSTFDNRCWVYIRSTLTEQNVPNYVSVDAMLKELSIAMEEVRYLKLKLSEARSVIIPEFGMSVDEAYLKIDNLYQLLGVLDSINSADCYWSFELESNPAVEHRIELLYSQQELEEQQSKIQRELLELKANTAQYCLKTLITIDISNAYYCDAVYYD